MRLQTTAVLFVIVLLLGVRIWWVDRDSARAESSGGGAAGNVLVRFDADKVDRLTLKRSNGEVIIEKRDDSWFFAAPIKDRVDPGAVKALLDTLGHLTILDEIDEGEIGSTDDLSLPSLGFAPDQVVEVEMAEGESKTRSILIGNATPLANSIYAKLPESDGVSVVKGNPRNYLDDPVAAMRDRRLIRIAGDRVVQVVVKTPLGEIEIRRKITPPVADWTLLKPLQTRANREMLESVLTGLQALEFDNVTDTGELPGALPTPIPDGGVALELSVFGRAKPVSLFLQPGDPVPAGQSPVLKATVSDRPAVFEVRSDLLASLPDTPDAFRDRKLARIAPQLVFGIGIVSKGYAPVILKTGKATDGSVRWFSHRNNRDEPANQARILGLIKAVNETEVLNFVSDSAARLDEFNLDQPAQSIAFSLYELQPETSPDGTAAPNAGQVGIAKKVLRLGSSDDGSSLFANFQGEPYIYEIGPEFLQKFYGDPLRWKSLNVITFNPINLREIRRKLDGEPELAMKYDYRRDSWEVSRGGEEVPAERLDRIRAAQLRDVLGSLKAVDWTTSPDVFDALQEPAVVFTVVTQQVDRATGKAVLVEHVLRFAPRSPGVGIFYGSMDDSPELFQIDRETYQSLMEPLMSRDLR